MKQHLCSSDNRQSGRPRDQSGFQAGAVVPICQICFSMLGQALRLPPTRLPPFLLSRHKLLLVPPMLSVLVHTRQIWQVLGRIPVHFPPPWHEWLKAHISPCSHQRGSFSPKHGHLSCDVALSHQLGLQCNWDLHGAVSLDNPRRHRAGIPCSGLLLVFLEGTESKATSELRKL